MVLKNKLYILIFSYLCFEAVSISLIINILIEAKLFLKT